MRFKIEGIIAAMVTPFTKGGGQVDYDKVARVAAYLESKGAAGLFPCGTTGEGHLLSAEERKTILEEVLDTVQKRTRVIAHTGAMDTATTIELTQHAQQAGAYAAAVVAPSFYSYDDTAIAHYYTAVANAAPRLPILLYNIPGCTHNPLSADLIQQLAEVENIVGIKDSSGSMPLLTRLFGQATNGFSVINGCDEQGYQAFAAGGKTVVSGSSNAYIDLYVDLYNQFKKGNLKKAWQAQLKLERATRLFLYGGGLGALKEIMRLRTVDGGYVRPPQRELTAAEKKRLAKGLEAQSLI